MIFAMQTQAHTELFWHCTLELLNLSAVTL